MARARNWRRWRLVEMEMELDRRSHWEREEEGGLGFEVVDWSLRKNLWSLGNDECIRIDGLI